MINAKAVMVKDIISVGKETDIYEAIGVMVENNITGLPIVNEDMTLAGIVSEKDVLKLLYNNEADSHNVEDFMTTNVITFDQEDSLFEIIDCFLHNHFRRVPILNNGRLAGIISRKDIISYIYKQRCKDGKEEYVSL